MLVSNGTPTTPLDTHFARLVSSGYLGLVAKAPRRPPGMTLRLPEGVHEHLAKLAARDHRNLKEEIIHLIEEEWRQHPTAEEPAKSG